MKTLFIALILAFSFSAHAYEAVPEQGRGTDGHPSTPMAAVNVDQLNCSSCGEPGRRLGDPEGSLTPASQSNTPATDGTSD